MAPLLRVGAGAEAVGEFAADGDFVGDGRDVQGLDVGIDDVEIDVNNFWNCIVRMILNSNLNGSSCNSAPNPPITFICQSTDGTRENETPPCQRFQGRHGDT